MLLYLIYTSVLYYQEKPSESDLTAVLPRIAKDDRVLIFAPHCDDETISSSGVLTDAVRAGSQVLVVFMTNGDGFTFAAEEQFKRLFLTSEDYIRSGYSRQAEALTALESLGLSPQQVIFLGYPDRGLETLWARQWRTEDPFVSHYTRSSHSPYAYSYEPNAPYAGENVLKNVEEILVRFRPTTVLLPHPHDEHHDHAATYAFVTAALCKLDLGRVLPRPHLYYYLVHRGDFPIPHGYLPDNSLLPPRPLQSLNKVKWHAYPLDKETETEKYRATLKYTSQIKVPIMSKLLLSLVRTNELFAEIPAVRVGTAPDGADLREARAWGGDELMLYLNPRAVHPVGVVENSRRVRTIYGCVQDTDIWLRLDIPLLSDSRWTYTLTYTGFTAADGRWVREARTFAFNPQEPEAGRDGVIFSQDSAIIKIAQQKPPDFFYIRIVAKDWWGFSPDETAWYLGLIPRQDSSRD
ncbi:MAG: PIG-L family deacetylase [Negativicutes bacterium]|nr:PIG-L family deacetylase [Negativicutes bacterium]